MSDFNGIIAEKREEPPANYEERTEHQVVKWVGCRKKEGRGVKCAGTSFGSD